MLASKGQTSFNRLKIAEESNSWVYVKRKKKKKQKLSTHRWYFLFIIVILTILHWFHTCKKKCIKINLLVAHQHFRTAVFNGSTKGPKHFSRSHVCCSSKVNQFNSKHFINDDILIFYITVNDVLTVKIGHPCHHLAMKVNKTIIWSSSLLHAGFQR